MTIKEINENSTLRDDISENPEKYLDRHGEFHTVSGCPVCQALARKYKELSDASGSS